MMGPMVVCPWCVAIRLSGHDPCEFCDGTGQLPEESDRWQLAMRTKALLYRDHPANIRMTPRDQALHLLPSEQQKLVAEARDGAYATEAEIEGMLELPPDLRSAPVMPPLPGDEPRVLNYVVSRRDGDHSIHNPLTGGGPFNKRSFGLDGHVSPYDNANIKIGTDGIEVRLLQGIQESNMASVLAACEQATIGMEVPEIEAAAEVWVDPAESSEMFKGGLQTALESQVIVFAVRGVDRTITHQIVRSRRAAFHQQSQRASFMGDAPEVRIPETVWTSTEAVRQQWLKAVIESHKAYREAVEADVPFQDARYILPEGTDTFIICEYPVREFLNVYAYRACSMFQWGIMDVMRKMREVLIAAHPWIEPYVKISCEKDHKCHFQGWEKVEGHCPFPWATEDNRLFKSERHGIEKQ